MPKQIDDEDFEALLAEYDALPGLGHACGHNLIATAGQGSDDAKRAVAGADSAAADAKTASASAQQAFDAFLNALRQRAERMAVQVNNSIGQSESAFQTAQGIIFVQGMQMLDIHFANSSFSFAINLGNAGVCV